MNSIICLFLFGIVFGVQARVQHGLFGEAEYLKNYINSVTNDLGNFEKSFTFNFFVELSKQKIQRYENVVYAMTVVLRELENATKAYMVQGIDASNCYQSAEMYLESKSKIVLGAFDKCMDGQTSLIDTLLVDIRSHLQTQTSILEYLNSVVLLCSSGTLIQVAPCVSNRMPVVKEAVKKYQSPVNKFKELASAVLYASAENNYQCAGPLMNSFYSELRKVRAAYNKCVWNAQ